VRKPRPVSYLSARTRLGAGSRIIMANQNESQGSAAGDPLCGSARNPHGVNVWDLEDQLTRLPNPGSNHGTGAKTSILLRRRGRQPASLLSGQSDKTSSTFTDSFYTAKTSTPAINFGSGSAAAYGTSAFSTSPLSQRLMKESSFAS
jgi:hypothetical protein